MFAAPDPMVLVTPTWRDQLSPLRKAALATEILVGYAQIRWRLRRDQDVRTVIAHMRAEREATAEAGRVPQLEQEGPRSHLAVGLRLAHAVIRTLTPLPADSRCLFRSLVLTLLLERRAIDSSLIVAVRPQPFAAHAWVEHAGTPLLPPGEEGFEQLATL